MPGRIYQSDGGDWIYSSGGVKLRFPTEAEAQKVSAEQDYITAVRAANRAVWEGINALKAAQRRWNALDYGNTLDDGEGDNAGILAADVGAVVFATTEALIAVLDAGSATNMCKLL
jgi:hypothetical protein